MKKPGIFQKRIGYSNVIIIENGRNSILVDTGVRGNFHQIKAMLRVLGLKPENIRLIILTHVHYDHTGNLRRIADLTGAEVLVHREEYENLKIGYKSIPRGTRPVTKVISQLGRIIMPKFASPKPFTATLVNTGEFDLSGYGFDAKVISTPGHSSGSQSVVLGKTLIAGDAFINIRNGIIFPPFADDPVLLLKTWKNIYSLGIEEIYHGHGPKLKVEKTYPVFEYWKKKLRADV